MLIARGTRPRAWLLVAALVLSLFPFLAPAAPAHADFTALCNGYAGCKKAGYGNAGYQSNNGRMYWRMYAGHNCTNYAAYRMVRAGMSNERPWSGGGNAENWGHAMAFLTDRTPMVGAVAWWDAYAGYAGSAGHVAYVEQVVSDTEIIVSEDMWGGDFHWRRVTKSGRGWPSGFIHFHDATLKSKKAPVITGTSQVGKTLSASSGTWSATPDSLSYQWFADGKAIKAATGASYTVKPAKLGKQITVSVAASAPGYAVTSASSAATADVAPGVMTPVEPPAVTGEPELGSVLTATKASFDPGTTAQAVQWRSDGAPIPGATGWTLDLGADQVGTRISAVVTATRKGYTPASVASPPTTSVLGGKVKTTAPFGVAGTPRIGEQLQVTPGTVEPADATATYSWLRDGEPVPGATGLTYTLGADDVGARISVQVDLARDGYKPLSETTEASTPVRTTPDLAVKPKGKHLRSVIVVRLTAPGVDTVEGPVLVRVGAQRVTAQMDGDKIKVPVEGLHQGERKVVVRYAAHELVEKAVFTGSVEIKPAKNRQQR